MTDTMAINRDHVGLDIARDAALAWYKRRQRLIDEAVRIAYPFQLTAVDPFANPVLIRRVYNDDEHYLRVRPWVVSHIRKVFRDLWMDRRYG